MSINRFEEGLPETPSVRPAPRLQPKLKDFIKGPMCARWLREAGKKNAGHRVGIALWQEVGFAQDEFFVEKRRQSKPIRVHGKMRDFYGLRRWTVSRGIKELREAGLIVVIENSPGQMQIVAIVNIGLDDDRSTVPF
jgi:hypothetical protein